MNLAVNQYANYLIQFLLELWNNTQEGNEIKEMIFKNFQEMCEKKFSSFICELYIKKISEKERNDLIKSLDLNYMLASNNQHVIKILKALGIYNNDNVNSKLPFGLNNNASKIYNFINNNSGSYKIFHKKKKYDNNNC